MDLTVVIMLLSVIAYMLGQRCDCQSKEPPPPCPDPYIRDILRRDAEREKWGKPTSKPPAEPPPLEAQLRHAAWELRMARWFGGIFDADRIRADIIRLEAEKEVRNAAIRQRILGNDPYASCPIANEAQATLAHLEEEKEAYNAAIRKRILGN